MTNDQASHIVERCIELTRRTSGHLDIIVIMPQNATQHYISGISFVVNEIPMTSSETCQINVSII